MSFRRRRNMYLYAFEDSSSSLDSPVRPRKNARKSKNPKKLTKRASRTRAPNRTNMLDSLEESLNTDLVNLVKNKVSTYFKSNGFISSDDDDIQFVQPASKSTASSTLTSTHTRNDTGTMEPVDPMMNSKPGCSKTSTMSFADTSVDSDIMQFVDEMVAKAEVDKLAVPRQDDFHDMDSLENYRKETEEMLKDTAKLLEEFKCNKKEEPPVPATSSPSKGLSDCAICLEPLKSRPLSATQCGHIFCTECIKTACLKLKHCPTCRAFISMKKIFPVYL